MKAKNVTRAAALGGLTLAALAVLAACGGSGSSGSPSSSPAAGSTNSASPSSGSTANGNRQGGGFAALFDDPQVKACLSAAGVAVPSFGARPSGAVGSGRPSGFPTGRRPSGFPSGARPSGAPSGGFRGGFGGGQNSEEFQKIQAALTACGISLPTFNRSGAPASPQSSGAASS